MRSFFDDWALLLGEIEIIVDNEIYTMAAGYVENVAFRDELYVRLWKNDNLLFGTRLRYVKNPDKDDGEYVNNVPLNVRKICIEQAERLDKLKAFA